jgi:uncharacterized protein YodC (DUF2158 family)
MAAMKVGDVVQLRSGGLAMTIILIREQRANDFDKDNALRQMVVPEFATVPGKKKTKSLVALCRWTENGQQREDVFPLGALKRVRAT